MSASANLPAAPAAKRLVAGGIGPRFWLTDGGPPLDLASPPLELVLPVKDRQGAAAKKVAAQIGTGGCAQQVPLGLVVWLAWI